MLDPNMIETSFSILMITMRTDVTKLTVKPVPRFEPIMIFCNCPTSLDKFKTYDADEIHRMIIASPSKTCRLDAVPSEIIKEFLNTFGITGSLHTWLTSFLSRRTQTVNFGGKNSSDRQLVWGVPQGICLGPLLFTLFVADLHSIAAHWGGLGFTHMLMTFSCSYTPKQVTQSPS